MSTKPMRAWIRVEEAAGPGLELGLDRGRPGPVITGAREGGAFLGMDRGAILDTDTGGGSPLPAVVALPASSAAGCWVEADLCDLLTDGDRCVVIATLPGHPLPSAPLVRVAARMAEGRFSGAESAVAEIRRANERFRRRRSAGRRPARPAWLPVDVETRQVVGASIASAAERDLARLPPRFVRGLTGLLDADERILASIERPPEPNGGLLGWRRARDRRAALLLLTDRQLLWLVDHVPPGRYLLDWGVDAELLPIERLRDLRVRFGPDEGGPSGLLVRTDAGDTAFPLPLDLEPKARAMAEVMARFIPGDARGSLLRRYPVTPTPFDPEPAERFGQGEEAMARVGALAGLSGEEPVAAFYAPRRDRLKRSVAAVVISREILLDAGADPVRVPLVALRIMSLALSPLVGRIELHAAQGRPHVLTYPAPLSEAATSFIRTVRRAWANGSATDC